MALGDRIAVMYQGRIVAILDPAEATPERLGLYMGGALVPPEGARGGPGPGIPGTAAPEATAQGTQP